MTQLDNARIKIELACVYGMADRAFEQQGLVNRGNLKIEAQMSALLVSLSHL